jgi:hypothetical protein
MRTASSSRAPANHTKIGTMGSSRVSWPEKTRASAATNSTPAMIRPTRTASSVAESQSRLRARNARSRRPPSMGKAGIRLNAPWITFARAKVTHSPNPGSPSTCSRSSTSTPRPARAKLTAGPATATRPSILEFSGISVMRAMPPRGQKVMSTTRMPKLRATRLCPSSCSSTQPKTSTRISTVSSGRAPFRCSR